MPAISAADARTQIVDLLTDTVYQALGLKETLEDERKSLESQDLDAIAAAAQSKTACVAKLQVLDNKRSQLCESWGFATGPDQMQELIDWCDDSELIASRWDHLLIIAAESSALNMTNGAIVRVRQQQFDSSLSLIRGVTPGSDTYGRNGGEAGDFGRRSLAEA
ncbi:MAG: flagellar protein FlgN [Gammaproteobacteria bacterium]|nr:flagellar protein FlgN [Gammaproteobacteria bacterium]